MSIALTRQNLQAVHDQHQVQKKVDFLEVVEVHHLDLVDFLEADE